MGSDTKPFRAPVARVLDYNETTIGTFIPQGRCVPIGNGYEWLLRGWEMFRSAPGTWIAITLTLLVLMVILVVLNVIPGMIPIIINLAVILFGPVFVGGLVIGCRAIEVGEGLRFGHLFAGFSYKTGALLMVGLLYLLAILAVEVAVAAVFYTVGVLDINDAMLAVGNAHASDPASWTFIVAVLAMAVLSVPLGMAVWLAPPLLVFHDISAFQALKTSFVVVLQNFAPFLVYGLLVLLYGLLVLLAAYVGNKLLFLGWLVLVPVVFASLYAFYRDVFFEP